MLRGTDMNCRECGEWHELFEREGPVKPLWRIPVVLGADLILLLIGLLSFVGASKLTSYMEGDGLLAHVSAIGALVLGLVAAFLIGGAIAIFVEEVCKISFSGYYAYVFLGEHQGEIHIHLNDPRGTPAAKYFVGNSMMRLRIGGVFRKNRIYGVGGYYWTVKCWTGWDVRLVDDHGSVLAFSSPGQDESSALWDYLNILQHHTSVRSAWIKLGAQRTLRQREASVLAPEKRLPDQCSVN